MNPPRWIPWLLCLMLCACQVAPPPVGSAAHPTSQTSGPQSPNPAFHAARAKLLAKTPYLGPIGIQLDPTLLTPDTQTQKRDLTAALNEPGFRTQAHPGGSVVYQETFLTSQQATEARREFRVTDTSLRYLVHVQRQGQIGRTEVLLNGTRWIQQKDFTHDQEAQSQGLLLNTNNSLLVRLQGRPGASVTVTVVQAGEAGTVLRRQGKLGLPGETQATHVRRGDINIFDGDLASLGGLEPYQGDLEFPASGTSAAMRISGLQADGFRPMRFETGVHVPQPETFERQANHLVIMAAPFRAAIKEFEL